jgi:hypothetical protein
MDEPAPAAAAAVASAGAPIAVPLGAELGCVATARGGPSVLPPAEKRVRIDVGGHEYFTTLGTLRRAPFFARVLPETFPGDVLEGVVVDRDARHFSKVLNVLRDGDLFFTIVPDTQEELLAEFNYYGLDAAARNVFLSMHMRFDQSEDADALWERGLEARAFSRIEPRLKAMFEHVMLACSATQSAADIWRIKLAVDDARSLYRRACGVADHTPISWAPPPGATELSVGETWLRVCVYGSPSDAQLAAALLAWAAALFPEAPPLAALLERLAAPGALPALPTDAHAPAGRVVRVRVGSHVFATTERTLSALPGSRLHALIASVPPGADTSAEPLFIDRDPTHFSTILNFLRDAGLRTWLVNVDMRALLAECDYYGIDGLGAIVRERIANNQKLAEAGKRDALKIDIEDLKK